VSVQARGHRPGAPVVLATESVQVEGAVARAANIPPGGAPPSPGRCSRCATIAAAPRIRVPGVRR